MVQATSVYFVASGKFHDIDFARLELLKLLAELPHLRVTVAPDYSDIEAICAAQFLITYTCDVVPTPEQTQRLRDHVAGGGRWLALHGTNSILRFLENGLVDCPDENPAFMELLGTQFKAHPPIGPFTVEITDPAHPLTAGLADFEIIDELYLSHRTADLHVLMHTQFTGKATGFTDEDWDVRDVPIFYLKKHGAGEILYLTLGHCRGHYDLPTIMPFYPNPERCAWNYPVYYELLRRGLRWASETHA